MHDYSDDFPAFAAIVHDQPGMADQLLVLQDRHGADVNLLLLCCWFGLEHGRMPASLLSQARQLADEWREQVISPLRDCRRRMKNTRPGAALTTGCAAGYQALREQIKAAELAAELQLESELQQLCERADRPCTANRNRESARENLMNYWRHVGGSPVQEMLDALLEAAWHTRTN